MGTLISGLKLPKLSKILRIRSLLLENDVVLLSSSACDLKLSLDRFAAKCEVARMRISMVRCGLLKI